MKALLAAILAGTALLCGPAQSAVILVDFEDQTPGVFHENLTINGFRFSPNFHYDLMEATVNDPFYFDYPSRWIGTDASGESTNPNFLGLPGGQSLWVDYSGRPFSFLGLDMVSQYEFAGDWNVKSSSNTFTGTFAGMTGAHLDFGNLFTGIQWIQFTRVTGGGQPEGFDNMRFNVSSRELPEPGDGVLLVGMGIAFLAYARRKRRPQ